MLRLDEISDRLEIQQLLAEYSTAVDFGRYDDLDDLFADDARIDLSATGGANGPYREVRTWLIDTVREFPAYAHLISNSDLRLAGDTATARTLCLNPLMLDDKTSALYLMCFWYDDEFVRTDDGWRIRRRTQVKCLDKLV